MSGTQPGASDRAILYPLRSGLLALRFELCVAPQALQSAAEARSDPQYAAGVGAGVEKYSQLTVLLGLSPYR